MKNIVKNLNCIIAITACFMTSYIEAMFPQHFVQNQTCWNDAQSCLTSLIIERSRHRTGKWGFRIRSIQQSYYVLFEHPTLSGCENFSLLSIPVLESYPYWLMWRENNYCSSQSFYTFRRKSVMGEVMCKNDLTLTSNTFLQTLYDIAHYLVH